MRKGHLLVWGLVGAYLLFQAWPQMAQISGAGLDLGDPIPVAIYSPLDGRAIDTRALRDDIVVVNFWATWCGPCAKELPMLEEIARQYRQKGVQLLAMNADQKGQDTVREYVKRKGLSLPVIQADRFLMSEYGGIKVYPTTLIFDGKRGLVNIYRGLVEEQQLKDQLDQLFIQRSLSEIEIAQY